MPIFPTFTPADRSELRWVDAAGLTDLDWPDADVPIIPLVQDLMSSA